jgi:hypothetical protein
LSELKEIRRVSSKELTSQNTGLIVPQFGHGGIMPVVPVVSVVPVVEPTQQVSPQHI